MRRTACVAAALLVSTLIISSCGDDDDDSGAPGSEPAETNEPVSNSPDEAFAGATLGFEGFGPIHLGMTPDEATRATGGKFEVDEPGEGENPECTYADVEGAPGTVRFMVQGDEETEWRVYRIEVAEGGTARTDKGLGNGSTEDEVKAVHNDDVRVEPNKYDPNGRDVIVDPDGTGGLAMVMVTDGNVVTSFRVGFEAAAFLVEGCA